MDRMTRTHMTARWAAAATLLACCVGVPAGSADAAGRTLRIGALLPKTGSLAYLGPAGIAGVRLAVRDINAAGGVFGRPVRLEVADSGDTRSLTAQRSVDQLLRNGADAIVGPVSSAVALTVIDRITGANKLMVSPGNTSTKLSRYPDRGLYFRTVPSDIFQGTVLGELAADDGAETMAILALQDSYGTLLAEKAARSFTAAGGKVVLKRIYDPTASSYAADVKAVRASKAGAVVVIGFEETTKILPELRRQGLLPQAGAAKKVYLVDGNLSNTYDLPAGTLTGVQGTLAGARPAAAFVKRLKAVNPKLKAFDLAAEAYDATILTALSAKAAGSDRGPALAAKMVGLSKSGTACRTFAGCVSLLRKGVGIDYTGRSGPIQFDKLGDVRRAAMGIYRYGTDNRYRAYKYVTGAVPGA
jgi:ABC-type branched-subunit amino acid transport system substrate-binding protein